MQHFHTKNNCKKKQVFSNSTTILTNPYDKIEIKPVKFEESNIKDRAHRLQPER